MPWPFTSNPPPQLLLNQSNASPVSNNAPQKPNFIMPEEDVNLLFCTHQNRILNNIIKPWNMLIKQKNDQDGQNQPLLGPKIRFSNCSVLSLEIKSRQNTNEFDITLKLVYVGNTAHNKREEYWVMSNTPTDNVRYTPKIFPNTTITIKGTISSPPTELSKFFGISNVVLAQMNNTGKMIRCLFLRHGFSQHNKSSEDTSKTILTINTNLKKSGEEAALFAGESMGEIFKTQGITLSEIGASDLIRTEQTLGFFIQGVKNKYPDAVAKFLEGDKQIITIPCSYEVPGKIGDKVDPTDSVTKWLTLGALKQGFWKKENKTNCRSDPDFSKTRFSGKERKDCRLITVLGGQEIKIPVNWSLYKQFYLQNNGKNEGYRDQQDLTFASAKCINQNFIGLFVNYAFSRFEVFSSTMKVEIPVDVTKQFPSIVDNNADDDANKEEYDDDDPNNPAVAVASGLTKMFGPNAMYGSVGGKFRKSRKSRNTKKSKKSKRYRKTKKAKKNRKTRKTRK